MSNVSDFIIENGVLIKYVGPGGDVVIPEGVTQIGREAFQFCWGLTGVVFPKTLKVIDRCAFEFCRQLTSVVFSDNIEVIGAKAFADSNLISAMLPDSVKYLDTGVFLNCRNLEMLHIPKYVSAIPTWFIGGTEKIKELILPDAVTSFKLDAFAHANGLERITGKNVTSIGGEIWDMKEVVQIIFPKVSVYDAEYDAFRMCLAMGFLAEPEGYEERVAKSYRKYLSSKTKEVLLYAFSQDDVSILDFFCKNKLLTKAAAENIYMEKAREGNAIQCTLYLLNWLRGKKKNTDPYSVGLMKELWNYRKRSDGTYELTKYKGSDLNVEIPPRIGKTAVTKLGDSLFAPDYSAGKPESNIKTVTLAEGIKEIGKKAFKRCDQLLSVQLPESLELIGMNAFEKCSTLEEIVFPDQVTIIEDMAFMNCSALCSVTLPKMLTRLGSGAFSGCRQLAQVCIPDEVTKMEWGVFEECKKLTKVMLPANLKHIDGNAFYGCGRLRDVYAPTQRISIDPYAFYKCRMTIHASAGSYAETYAKENNIPFVAE